MNQATHHRSTPHAVQTSAHLGATSPAVRAYPSLRAAAEMVGVNASTLQRRKDLSPVQAGRERRLSATATLELTAYYGKRALPQVAYALVARAAELGDEQALAAIEAEVDAYLSRDLQTRTANSPLTAEEVLNELAQYISEADLPKAKAALARLA